VPPLRSSEGAAQSLPGPRRPHVCWRSCCHRDSEALEPVRQARRPCDDPRFSGAARIASPGGLSGSGIPYAAMTETACCSHRCYCLPSSALPGRRCPSDLFSLGAVLYEMLSGRRAFRAEARPRPVCWSPEDPRRCPRRFLASLLSHRRGFLENESCDCASRTRGSLVRARCAVLADHGIDRRRTPSRAAAPSRARGFDPACARRRLMALARHSPSARGSLFGLAHRSRCARTLHVFGPRRQPFALPTTAARRFLARDGAPSASGAADLGRNYVPLTPERIRASPSKASSL